MKEAWVRCAHILALLWALFWMFFFIAESAVWQTPLAFALPWMGLGLILVIVALIPRQSEGIGGLLLMAAGLLGGLAYALASPLELPLASRMLTTLVFGVPPIAAGILFLMHSRTRPASV